MPADEQILKKKLLVRRLIQLALSGHQTVNELMNL